MSDGIRIGIDATSARQGGGVTYLTELLRAFDPQEFGISKVVVWGGDDTLSKLPQRDYFQFETAEKASGSIGYRLYWQRSTLDHLAAKHVDVLFAPGGIHLGKFRPCVAVSQNLLPFVKEERWRFGWSSTNLRLLAVRRLQKKTFRRADGVIFMTHYAREKTLDCIGSITCPTAVIGHGVSPAFEHAKRQFLPISKYSAEKPFRWLYVSSVDVYKHQLAAVEAVGRLYSRGYPVALDIVGGAAHEGRLQSLVSRMRHLDPSQSYLKYHGEVPYQEIASIYDDANAFVLASSCESFGMIALEALRSGLPMACSNMSSLPEVVGDAAVYFNPLSVDSIMVAMQKLMEDTAIQESSSQKGVQQASKFSWEECSRETFEFICQCSTSRR